MSILPARPLSLEFCLCWATLRFTFWCFLFHCFSVSWKRKKNLQTRAAQKFQSAPTIQRALPAADLQPLERHGIEAKRTGRWTAKLYVLFGKRCNVLTQFLLS